MHPSIEELIGWAGRVIRLAAMLKHALWVPFAVAVFGLVAIVVALAMLGAPVLLILVAAALALLPVWRLWSFRSRVAAVEDVPDQLRDLGDIDDDLGPRIDAVVDAATDEGSGALKVLRTLRSVVAEGRGALADEFKPVQDLVATFHPARLAEAWAAMWFGAMAAGLGAVLLVIALL